MCFRLKRRFYRLNSPDAKTSRLAKCLTIGVFRVRLDVSSALFPIVVRVEVFADFRRSLVGSLMQASGTVFLSLEPRRNERRSFVTRPYERTFQWSSSSAGFLSLLTLNQAEVASVFSPEKKRAIQP